MTLFFYFSIESSKLRFQDLDHFASSLLLFLWNRRSACGGLLKFTFR